MGCWFFHSFALGEIGGEKDWRREVAKSGGKSLAQPVGLSTHVVGYYCHPKQCHSSHLFCGHWATLGTVNQVRLQLFWRKNPKSQAWELSQVLIKHNCIGRNSSACREPGDMYLTICRLLRSCFRASTNNWELHSMIYYLYINFSRLEWKFKYPGITGKVRWHHITNFCLQ